jgi:hypothetical protein
LGWTIAGNQDFISGIGADFDLVGTLWKVVAREVHETMHATYCHVFSCRVYTDSNQRGILVHEWSLASCCHLVVCS